MITIQFINAILGAYLWVIFGGIIHLLLRNWRVVYGLIAKKNKRTLKEELKLFQKPLYYLIGGSILAWSAYVISSWILTIFFRGWLPTGTGFFVSLVPKMGLFMVFGMVLSGYALTLSAGERWLVNLSKLLVVIAILTPLIISFLASII